MLLIFSDVQHNVKLKSKKLFTFPKKSKHMQSVSSKAINPPFNVAQTLKSIGLQQIQQMITFLSMDESKLGFNTIFVFFFPYY